MIDKTEDWTKFEERQVRRRCYNCCNNVRRTTKAQQKWCLMVCYKCGRTLEFIDAELPLPLKDLDLCSSKFVSLDQLDYK